MAEHLSIPDPELSQHGVDETDQTAGRGKALPKRSLGTKSPGATSAFSGNTARISGSAPSWVDSDPAEEISKGTLEKSVENEAVVNANGVQTRPVFRTLSGPLDTTLQQSDVPQQPTPNAGRLSNSSTRYVVCHLYSVLALLVHLLPKSLMHTKLELQIQLAQDNSKYSGLSEANESEPESFRGASKINSAKLRGNAKCSCIAHRQSVTPQIHRTSKYTNEPHDRK